ncbi:MAG: zinc ribbon domain-containing protein [Methanobrevibacter sp.]|nr:zinc ribbon domain-containing protein [Methanobrevibacter sp.]
MSKFKICDNCGKKVKITSNFCPNCKSQSFGEISTADNIKYILFYWEVDGGFMLSKTKLVSLFILISCAIDWFIGGYFSVLEDVLLAIVLFAIGFALHKILKNDKPSDNVVNNNDDGFINDLIHLLFYWQDKESGKYEIAIAKILSLVSGLLLGLYYDIAWGNLLIMRALGAGIVIAIPVFTVGYIIHRIQSK